jgi:hypothetical protein
MYFETLHYKREVATPSVVIEPFQNRENGIPLFKENDEHTDMMKMRSESVEKITNLFIGVCTIWGVVDSKIERRHTRSSNKGQRSFKRRLITEPNGIPQG